MGIALQHVLLGVVPLVATALLAMFALRVPWAAGDFRWSYYPAASRLIHGTSPYAVTAHDIAAGTAFVYPALSAIVFAPFALVGRGVSDHLYMLLCFLLVPSALWAARVRDWRVYGITLLWLPTVVGWEDGNVTVPLAFLTVLVWRYRERPWVAGLLVAAAISLKPFVWPLGLWLLATRRWRAAVWAIGCGALLNLAAWAVVGFDEIHTYLHLSSQVTDALWRGGYGMLAVAHHLGFGRGVGDALLAVAAILVGVGLVYVGFSRRDERQAMVLATALMLVASPLVWNHYFFLLLVPLALTRPKFGAIWTIPLAMWVMPPSYTVTGWQIGAAWAVTVACFAVALGIRGMLGQGGRPASRAHGAADLVAAG
jgi:hypothetical protein